MDYKKKAIYHNLKKSYTIEPYQAPVTMSYPEWIRFVSKGENTLYGDAVVPSGTIDNGAVYVGHVRQNPFTAGQ